MIRATVGSGPGAAAAVRRPNVQLSLLIEEAGFSRLALARSVREVLTRRGLPARCTHNNVRRWCDGHSSRSVPPEVIAEVLAERLGRIVTAADIGMADPAEEPPVGYAAFVEHPLTVAASARALWRADLDDAPSTQQEIPAAALSTPVLRWLVCDPAPAPSNRGRRQVTDADLVNLRAQARLFDELARRQGGGAARRPAVQYLLSTLAPVLTGRYGTLLGRELFRAAGESVLAVAGHTADTPRHGLTRRYHVLALNLAHQAGDRDLGGAVLVSLAEHLLGCGEVDPAADVLGAVRQGANPSAAWHAAAARLAAERGEAEATAAHLALAGPAGATTAVLCALTLDDAPAAVAAAQAALGATPPWDLRATALLHAALARAHARLGAPAAARASAELATEAAAGLTSTAVADAVAALPRQRPQD